MKLSLVIPVYNEVENIVELTNRLNKTLKRLKIEFELIYVVQGRDGAYKKLAELKKHVPQIRTKYFREPLGIGPAFKIGFNMVSDDMTHVLTMDGDLNHQPEELGSLISKMDETNSDIIIGSRKVKGGSMINMPWYKKIISGLTNIFLYWILSLQVKDLTSGYRLFKKEVIFSIRNDLKSKNFEVYPEILLLSKNKGFNMAEVPITFKYRLYGKSKLNFLTSGLGYIKLFCRTLLPSIFQK